jgi:hypothetical protein
MNSSRLWSLAVNFSNLFLTILASFMKIRSRGAKLVPTDTWSGFIFAANWGSFCLTSRVRDLRKFLDSDKISVRKRLPFYGGKRPNRGIEHAGRPL